VHFNHNQIKNAVAVFGSLFNNIVLQRRDGKILPVPISYGPRDKWLEAQKALKREEELFEKLLPRMSYELVSMSYDTERKIGNKQTVLRSPDNVTTPRQKLPVPVPYLLDFTLYIQTKNLNDGWQIVEQILPFFTPAYTVKVRHFPADGKLDTPTPDNTYDMPITLTAVTWADDWTGQIEDRRVVEWTLEFSTKIYMFGPVASTSIILDSRAIIAVPPKGKGVTEMSRVQDQEGTEVGFVNVPLDDSEAVYENDSDLSPRIINLEDSDGNIIKIVRPVSNI
jgi:hypothetical protein